MIHLTRAGVHFTGGLGALAEAKERYQRRHWVKLEGLFSEELLARIDEGLDPSAFATKTHGEFGVELCLRAGPLTDTLASLSNTPELLRFVEELTDCGHLGCFEGRVYRALAASGHRDAWHSDVVAGRMVALSVNLGREAYAGGHLELRSAGVQAPLDSVENTGRGDALLFRVSRELEHRITDVSGAVAKTAWAGWFRARPEYADVLAGRANL